MSNFILYCKDFEKYKNYQEWSFWDNHIEIKIVANRNENTYCWEGYITRIIKNKYLTDIINKISHGGIISMTENTYCWEGYITRIIKNKYLTDIINKISHGGIISMTENTLGFGFATYRDYKPKYDELKYYKNYFSSEKIENLKYWTFPEIKTELEKIAGYYKTCEPISS